MLSNSHDKHAIAEAVAELQVSKPVSLEDAITIANMCADAGVFMDLDGSGGMSTLAGETGREWHVKVRQARNLHLPAMLAYWADAAEL